MREWEEREIEMERDKESSGEIQEKQLLWRKEDKSHRKLRCGFLLNNNSKISAMFHTNCKNIKYCCSSLGVEYTA